MSVVDGSDQALLAHLWELVRRIGLKRGQVLVVVHEGRIAKIEVHPSLAICIDQQMGVRGSPACSVSLQSVVDRKLLDGLEKFLIARIGRFGDVTLEVEPDRIYWTLSTKGRG